MVHAMLELMEAIRDPRPRARGKTVWPGRAERAADDAGEKMPEARAERAVSGILSPASSAARSARRAARPGQTVFPLARGRGSRIASTNFAIASTSQIEGNRGALIILIVMAAAARSVDSFRSVTAVSCQIVPG